MTTKSKTQDKNKMNEIDENISKLFDIKKRLGKGAYGIVWKALDKRTNETLAVKKIFDAFRDETDAQRTFREIIFLKAFRNHPNVVKLNNVYRASNNLDIYLIFEYMESDLHNIIKKGTILKDIHKRYVMYQLINAIKYIHSGNVIHRDLKPSNVLIDSKCRCKLADFGLARSVSHRPIRDNSDMSSDPVIEPLLTDYVATRWYRAPEILVASKRYTKGIDMWSLGCILGEMIRGKPLFQGSSTVNQIEKIVTALPDITEQDISAVGAGFGSVLLSKQISRERKTTLDELLSDAPDDAVNLVKSLLVLDPLGRLNAKQALCHAYVEKFRNSIPEIELNVDILPPFRDDVRLSVPEYRAKLYEIVQGSTTTTTTDKNNCLRQSVGYAKNVIQANKHRDPKSQISYEKTEAIKRSSKAKQYYNSEEKYLSKEKYMPRPEKHESETTTQKSMSITSAINKALKKNLISPIARRKSSNKSAATTTTNPEQPKHHMAHAADLVERERAGGHYVVPKSKAAHTTSSCSSSKPNEVLQDAMRMYAFEKRHSIDGGYGSLPDGIRQPPTPNGLLRKISQDNTIATNVAYKRSSSLHRASDHNNHQHPAPHTRPTTNEKEAAAAAAANDRNRRNGAVDANERLNRSTPVVSTHGNKQMSYVRDTKSDTMAAAAANSKSQERICYEKRLRRLEEEIEKYKKEVKSFCKETYRYSQQSHTESTPTKITSTTTLQQQTHGGRSKYGGSINAITPMPLPTTTAVNRANATLPTMATTTTTTTTGGTPKKNPYFQLLAKGNRDFGKSDFELAYTGSGGSGDHIERAFHNSGSGGIEVFSEQNAATKQHSVKQHHQQQHNNHHHQQHQSQPQHHTQQRIRPVSKFI